VKDETTTGQTPELTEKEKARETFAALFELIDILAAEHEKEQEETHHVD
jgi:hypothetical protein